MSIQKKSLISTLQSAKKANVAKTDGAVANKGNKQVSAVSIQSMAKISAKKAASLRLMKTI